MMTRKPTKSPAGISSAHPYANDLCVFIGRFQPFHDAHLKIVEKALINADRLVFLIGSANEPRNHRNPWTYDERVDIISSSLTIDQRARVHFRPLEDVRYNDTQWVLDAQMQVNDVVAELGADPLAHQISLIGHSKDVTSYYLKLFPQWNNIDVESLNSELSATRIRTAYFSNMGNSYINDLDGHKEGDGPRDHFVPSAVKDFLAAFIKTPEYAEIKAEYEYVTTYKAQFSVPKVPYPVVFVTVDACVVQAGHVLLVQRGGRPGKGLWALPGGFIKIDESIRSGIFRELEEETKIKVPPAILLSSLKRIQTFDDPQRSARGRTITHCGLITLPENKDLPDIKRRKANDGRPVVEAADDAEKAQWWNLANVTRSMMFEDHFDIIRVLTNTL